MSAPTDRYENAAARYLEAWNARGPEALSKAVAAAWAPDGSYTDPLADVRGHEQIAAVIAGAHEQFPGFSFRLSGTVDGHHDTARFSWELVADGGAPSGEGSAPVAGFDVITLDDEGRIRSVFGFLDRVPEGA
ncbi:nuclear transport factor 2 family protein [Streptomyces mexicanus]|uniref:Nuclear transport factor 2 family protein n=1 Tax=Streptomyces mexicanus TaxID=178566 RepID=A0A7X1LPC9_9ACTN|nr:nuclear transport factor 2 family protein [Streptomyces mexicanus]MBC2864728.1 nuclear transport factor 2 family protein [Streptomyces mexicanus]